MSTKKLKDKITLFSAKNTKSKVAYSPYNDKTFTFETFDIDSNVSFFNTMVSHFTLCLPLGKIQKPIRCTRTVSDLKMFYNQYFTYLIIDITVNTEYNKNKIVEYFKDYKCILGESRSYDAYNNFNIKGVIFTEPLDINELKVAFNDIQNDIKELGVLNDNTIKRATFNAPILKSRIFYNNENGVRFKKVSKELKDYIQEYSKENIDNGTFNNITGSDIQELCLKTFNILGFTAIKENSNGSLTFKDTSGHANYFWFPTSPYNMNHPNKLKSINIFNIIKDTDDGKKLLKSNLNYENLLCGFNTGENYEYSEEYLDIYNKEEIIDRFLHKRNGVLSIKSPMGTAKSTVIKHIIDECHNIDMKVLVVTNRISVAEDFADKYKLKLYNKDKYDIGDSLIVQYDSLWKYNITYFDIIVMDEFVSLLLHSRNNLSNNNMNLIKFFGCFNKKMIIADAFLTGYEHFIMNKTDNIINIINNYRDKTKLTLFENKYKFLGKIKEHSIQAKEDGKSISVSCTSTNMIHTIKNMLIDSGLNVVTLTGDTPNATKEIIYKLFRDKNNDRWDVIIYSPTLTVGVSNMNNVEDHFHYDTGNSADVISSIQMIKRSRRARNIHMYLSSKTRLSTTDYNSLRDLYINNAKLDSKNSYLFDTDDYGELRLSKVGAKSLKIDTLCNILNFNHKDAFLYLLKYHFEYEPEIIEGSYPPNVKHYNVETNTLIEEYNNVSGEEYVNDKVLDIINEIIEYVDERYKDKFIDLRLSNPQLFQYLRYYKIASTITKEKLTDFLSEAILDNNYKDVTFFKELAHYNLPIQFNNKYTPRSVYGKEMEPFRNILKKCGYKLNNTYNKFSNIDELIKYLKD